MNRKKLAAMLAVCLSIIIIGLAAVGAGYGTANYSEQGGAKWVIGGGGQTGELLIDVDGTLHFEGATADGYETAFAVTDPTADRTVTLANASGTVVLSSLATNAPEAANSIWGASNGLTYEGASADGNETTVTVTDPTADRTITLPDVTGTVLLSTSAIRTGQQFTQGVAYAKVGTGAGWTIGAADDISLATMPASQTAGTMVIPVTVPLKVGAIITGFSVNGQIESAGNTATLDAALWKMTAAAADFASASVSEILQISKTADYKVVDSNTLSETVAADETFFVLLTGTTAASTDIAIGGITITVTEP